ncbi:MAG: hypothetical protein QM500_01300 [Methylococcales bacterium]
MKNLSIIGHLGQDAKIVKTENNDPKAVLKILKKGLKVYVDGSPTFGLRASAEGTGVFPSITINVNNMEFMSKKAGE